MPKNSCSCNDDSQKNYINEAQTFKTHFHLDNKLINVFENPFLQLKKIVNNSNSVSLVDRANCNSCDSSIPTQEKLKVRKKDRPTPYRVPFNHFRKVSSCKEDCITNVKIIKDLSCNNIACPVTNYAISRLVDKNGVRNINNGGNYKNYLQNSGKTFYLNTAGILPENAVSGKIHTYKIGALENTVYNFNSGTTVEYNCRLNYSTTTSLTEKSFTLSKINTTTKKYSNPTHKTSGSVSSKAHLQRKKFKNILAGQGIGVDGYNNCRNGDICAIYMKPGPNTKLFMGKTAIQRCIPPRIRGIKQTCPVPPATCESIKDINPSFERNEYTETFNNNGYLKITIDHCPLKEGDVIRITFLGYSTNTQTIFSPNSSTSALSALTASNTVEFDGTIIDLEITEIYVNGNNIYWIMPVDVRTGTTTIILNDNNTNTIVNNTNGPDGIIYATVRIPRHFDVNSAFAWNITPIDPCYYRQLNGIGAITSYTVMGGAFLPIGTFVNASVPNGTTHNPEDLLMQFTLSNEDFQTGDVLIIEFYTSSSFGTGFFNTTNYPSGISNWNLNPTPVEGQEFNPGTTIPTLLLINADISNPNQPQLSYNANYFSAASWSGTDQIYIGANIYYKQTLSITIGSSPPDTTSSNEVYFLYIFRAEQTVEGNTTYTNLFSDHPTSAGDVKFQISCNCYTGTGITDGYNFGGPCSSVASNAAFTINNATEGMSLANYDDAANLITPITTYIPGLNPPIVKFTFSLSYTGNQGLTKGDVIVFRVTTDYGDQDSGFFTSYGSGNNMTWQLNKRPQAGDDDYGMIWLEQGGSVLDGNGYGIESINFANYTYNTNTNVYSHFLYVTIGKNITNISNAEGSLTLGIYANNDIITTFPSTAYNISYEIDSYCWTSTGNQSDISYDPCGGRSGSLTNSSLEATGFGQETPIVEGGDFVRLCSIEFTVTNAGLLGGDILILKLITSYTGQYNTVDGFFTDNPSFITLNANGYTGENNGGTIYPAMWISQGTTGLTPVSGMISSLSTTFSTTGSGATQKYIQTISITLSGDPFSTTYGSAGTTWKINISGAGSSTVDITQIPTTAGTIDYQLDLNCFTGTGEQSGTSWQDNPCFGRGTGTLTGISVTTYPTNLVGGGDELEYQIIQIYNSNDTVRGGDVITIKFRTTYNSFFTGSMSNSDWYKNNDNPTSSDKPRVYLQLYDPPSLSYGPILNAISTATTSAAVQDGNKWIQTVTLTLISGSTIYAPSDSNLMIYIRADNLTNTSSYITQPSANTGGIVEHEVDINCFTSYATFASQNLVYSYGIAGSLTSLSLLPNNFEGFQRTYEDTDTESYGLGQNLDTDERQKPFYDLKNTQGRNGQTGSNENLQFYTNSEIAADLNLRNITSRFTISNALASGSSIKITFWKEDDDTLSVDDRPFFDSGTVGSNTTANEPFTLTGGYSSSENLYIEGKYNTGGNDTVFTFSSYTISSYSGNEQSITLTTAANIPANANIKIIFHDHFGDALCSNPREGRGIYYDLEVTSASTSGIPVVYTKQEDNLGWYSQDISANLDVTAPGMYPPSSGGIYIFSDDLTQPSILTYRHHNAIPSGSKIRLTWSAQNDPFSSSGAYNFFKGHGTTTENLISNTSTPSTGNVGIIVESHTTLNSTSGTNINISDFELGTLVASYNANINNNVSDNHGSVEYIEFEIDNNIAGAPVSKTTNAATRFIEIKVYGGHNLQPPGGFSSPSWYASGDHRLSIEVRNSDDILIGAIYNVFYYNKP